MNSGIRTTPAVPPAGGPEDFVQICLLASGSKGNAVFIESGESRILIDAGLSARELSSRLEGIGKSPENLQALLVTHEHGDHSRGVGPMARRHRIPVYMHTDTRRSLPSLGRLDELHEFESGDVLPVRDMRVETFQTTHDAVAPVGFTIETSEGKIGFATDLGIATRLVRERLKGCRMIVLEFNHDEAMLRDGPYPWPLKQRIRSNHGHLSNSAAAELLEELLWEGLEAVFLAHMSETNNTAELVLECAGSVLDRQNACAPRLILGLQDRAGVCISL
jgi:phosphoribosyl 1,2-cyclic phosphodiesterase